MYSSRDQTLYARGDTANPVVVLIENVLLVSLLVIFNKVNDGEVVRLEVRFSLSIYHRYGYVCSNIYGLSNWR